MKKWILSLSLTLMATACGSSDGDSNAPEGDSNSTVWPHWPRPPRPMPPPAPKPVPMPPPVPVPDPAPQPTPVPPPGVPAQSIWEALHNDLRLKHGVAAVKQTPALTAEAQAWADRCVFQHAQGTGHGENLAIGTGLTADQTMKLWYDEGKNYPYGSATPPMSYMHFTQVIWKGTTEIGCARAACQQGNFYVCRYNPPGNYLGQFDKNVFPPK